MIIESGTLYEVSAIMYGYDRVDNAAEFSNIHLAAGTTLLTIQAKKVSTFFATNKKAWRCLTCKGELVYIVEKMIVDWCSIVSSLPVNSNMGDKI